MGILVWAAFAAAARGQATGAADAVGFNRDIRPILSDNCFQCHGPDAEKRQADLRLDLEAEALAPRDGGSVLVPGDREQSLLFQRITAPDVDERMPPADSGRALTPDQIELIGRWIEQGAQWQKHWSLIGPEKPPLPEVGNREWVRNEIDRFVLARLEREGLTPSPEADKETLIRRLSLDLTGLPPTPAEVDAFLSDRSPEAYSRVVDRLLSSPRYGERMAVPWLDAARYADTNGYQSDGDRFMWRWRDWVIEAFNRNMPFDQFTIEQLAGDLLAEPTLEQRIATGFNRNHRGNAEGGIIPEEYLVEYVVDRVDTTATVWLGLTLGCARCHDHKFDPFTQREFYQLFAFFHHVPERGKAIKFGNSPPMIKAPTRHQRRELAQVEQELARARDEFQALEPELAAAQAAWEQTLSAGPATDWTITRGLVAHWPLDGDTNEAAGGTTSGSFQSGPPAFAQGRVGEAADFDGARLIEAGDVARFGFYDKFSLAAWVYPSGEEGGVILSRMTDAEQADGYYVALEGGKLQVNLVKRWLDDALRVQSAARLAPDRWHHLLVTYDGSRVAAGIQVYADGEPLELEVLLDDLNQSFDTLEPVRIGGGGGPEGRFHGRIDDVRIYNQFLTPEEALILATTESVAEIASLAPENRSAGQKQKIHAWHLVHAAPEHIGQAWRRLVDLEMCRDQLVESLPTTMIMQELEEPRPTFVLVRGQYDKPGEPVEPGLPASLPPLAAGAPSNRLGLARWLVDPGNPLTARVTVNRFWQLYFGAGLVRTAEDFGSQGDSPSHPELLDWLATEFMAGGWDVKALQRLIVTSATYRQSSDVPQSLERLDPENRLLARGPRFRLPAEMIRDQALAASGLLVERLGGPSVMPYQPPGLWTELTGTVDYVQGHGDDLYRRSMYTFWKRTVPPPTLATFDATARETCTVRRARTNTPLQALALLNDVTFVEAARVLAARAIAEGGSQPADRVALAFRLATGRRPKPAELEILLAGLERHVAWYRDHPQEASELVSAGERPRNPALDIADCAAYTVTAGLVLNLDEAVTKD